MNILITGVAGLIGSRLAEHIIKTKSDVTVYGIDDLSGGYMENVPPEVIFLKLDAGNSDALDDLFLDKQFDIVYHFAAYAAECVSPFIRKFNYTNNLLTTANIVNLCIKYNVGRLVFTSSMAVYGRGALPFMENQERHPIDPYGIAKAACEMDIEVAGEQHGLDYCILRPHNCYGSNQNIFDPYRNFIGISMYKAIIGDPITVFGDGKQIRAFSEMTDIVEPLWQAGVVPAASKQIINIGGIKESTILDVAEIVGELSGTKIIHLPPRHEVKYAYSTHEKSQNILGFEHKTELYDGIKNMWNWAQQQPKRERFVWEKYELDKGLYPQWTKEALADGYFKGK